jgi:hypothetical protein
MHGIEVYEYSIILQGHRTISPDGVALKGMKGRGNLNLNCFSNFHDSLTLFSTSTWVVEVHWSLTLKESKFCAVCRKAWQKAR